MINRDADQRGFRLQRLRAAKTILELANDPQIIRVFVANEAGADVKVHQSTGDASSTRNEEDKNYASDFSINSPEIRNTLVIFLDTWLNCQRSRKIRFLFYTCANAVKERQTEQSKADNIVFPEFPVLKLMQEKRNGEVLSIVSKVIKGEYSEQYKDHSSEDSFKDVVKKLNDAELLTFLSLIDWKFGESNQMELEEELLKAIKGSIFFNTSHIGKEETLKDALTGLLDKHQCKTDPIARFITGTDVENTFLKISAQPIPGMRDPAWSIFESIDRSDFRNLSEKVGAVDSKYPAKNLEQLINSMVLSKREQMESPDERGIKSLKYCIYVACLPVLQGLTLPIANIDEILQRLYAAAIEHVENRAKEFHYPLTNRQSIQQIVLDLFEDCFLSFDGEVAK